jgi:hypothetical protein
VKGTSRSWRGSTRDFRDGTTVRRELSMRQLLKVGAVWIFGGDVNWI